MASGAHDMSVSLHGFMANPNEKWDDEPLGDDGGYLRGCFPDRRTLVRLGA